LFLFVLNCFLRCSGAITAQNNYMGAVGESEGNFVAGWCIMTGKMRARQGK